jgi:hypothetical protein
MASIGESSAHLHPGKADRASDDADDAGDAGDAGDSFQGVSSREQGELQQNDYDVETVERVYRFVFAMSY